MQNTKQIFNLNLFVSLFLASTSMLLLFSCSKSNNEIIPNDNPLQSVAGQASPADVTVSVESIPYENSLFVPCANGGNGEVVELKGTMHIVDQVVRTENRFKLTYNLNMQNVSGTGLTTGDTYRASGGGPGTLTGSLENGQFTAYYIETVRIVSRNSTYFVKYKFHVTINANGVFTAYVSEENETCNN